MRRHLLAATLAAVLISGFSVPMHAVATGDFVPGGFLRQASQITFNYSEFGSPENLVATDSGLFFVATDPVYGRELHRWHDGEIEVFDSTPGPASSEFFSPAIQPFQGGVALTSSVGVGWHNGTRLRWATWAEIGYKYSSSNFTAVGDTLYVLVLRDSNDVFDRKIVSVKFNETSTEISEKDWATKMDSDPEVSLNEFEVFGGLASLGSWLAFWALDTDVSSRSGLYVLDTSAEAPLFRNTLARHHVADVVRDGDRLYSYTPTGSQPAGTLFWLELDSGNITLNDSASPQGGEVVEVASSGGQVLTLVETLNDEILMLFEPDTKTFIPTPFSSSQFGFPELSRAAVINPLIDSVSNPVLYLPVNSQLAAWELGLSVPAWDVLSLSGVQGVESPGAIATLGVELFFVADSGTKIGIYRLNTLTEELEELFSQDHTSPYSNESSSPVAFGSSIYFFANYPGNGYRKILYRLTPGETASLEPVLTSQGHFLQVRASENQMLKLGEKLFFLAEEAIEENALLPGLALQPDVWSIASHGGVPTKLDWPNKPEHLKDHALASKANQAVMAFTIDEDLLELASFAESGAVQNITLPEVELDDELAEHIAFLGIDQEQFVVAGEPLKWLRLDGASATPISFSTVRGAEGQPITFESFRTDYVSTDPETNQVFVAGAFQTSGQPETYVLGHAKFESGTLILQVIGNHTLYTPQLLEIVEVAGDRHLLYHGAATGGNTVSRVALVPISDPPSFVGDLSGYFLEDGNNNEREFGAGSAYIKELGALVINPMDSNAPIEVYLRTDEFTHAYPLGRTTSGDLRVSGEHYALLGNKAYMALNSRSYSFYDEALFEVDFSVSADADLTLPMADFLPVAADPIVYSKPAGASNNLILKGNYPDPDPDSFQRANSPTPIETAFFREDAELIGWATSADGPVVYDAGANFEFDRTATLFAKWNVAVDPQPEPEPDPAPAPAPPPSSGSAGASMATVSFATEVSSTALNPMRVTTGTRVVLPKLQKQGHVFLGWSETKDGLLVGEAYRPASSVQLHPVFKPLEVKLFFSLPAGAKGASSMVWRGDQDLVLPSPTMAGKTFVVWVNAENGERITSDWVPTEPIMLAPLFREGSADHVVNFWLNSSWVTNTQMGRLTNLVRESAILNGRRTIVITGFDERDEKLARKRALNTAIKLRKLGVKDAIELQGVVQVGSKPRAELTIN